MATIRKRGKCWRAEVYRNGQRRSKTFHIKAQAQSWALKVEVEMDDQQLGRVPADKQFESILNRYAREVSPKKRGAKIEILRIGVVCRDEIARVNLRSLAPSDFAAWRDRRLKKVSVGSVLREWGLLSHVCSVAVREWGWLNENPLLRVKHPSQPRARTRRIDPDEIERLLVTLGYHSDRLPEGPSARAGAAMLFAIETAMRAGEIAGMTWQNVDVDRRAVHIPVTKNGHPRDIPLSREAIRILEQMRPLTGGNVDGRVFGLASAQISKLFAAGKKRAMIEDVHFHDTRREALTRLAQKFDVMDLAKISGHRDLRILQNVYYAPKVEDLVNKLD